MWRIAAIALLALSLPAPAAWDDPNIPEAREHPLLKFYPQASVGEYTAKDFDAAEIVTAYSKGAPAPATVATFEGRVTTYHYAHKPNTSPLEIVRQYEAALRKNGFQTIVAGKGASIPGTPDTNDDDAFGSFRLERNGRPVAFVQVLANYNGGPESVESKVVIVEPRAMEQKLEANAEGWFDELSKSGRVAVYGINFDTGKAAIRPDSALVLEEIRKLAAAHPELKLMIEGHTDNAGEAAANRKLSEDRASAVKAWLARDGVKKRIDDLRAGYAAWAAHRKRAGRAAAIAAWSSCGA
jgi:outer membrane protein OmpA-like peptidoglycan-associated protein